MTASSPAEQPVLRTDRLVLRPFTPADAADVQRLVGTREVADTTLSIPHPYPEGGAAQWIATHAAGWHDRTNVVYAITRASDGALVGAVGLGITAAHSHAELGYWIAPAEWNNGYATEAARAIIRFAFDVLGLHRVQARHFTRNPQSGAVMRKLGMRIEGTQRGALKKWDRFEDVVVYAVLRTDPEASRHAQPPTTRS